MPASRRFRVTLAVEVDVTEPFIVNGVPDQQLIARMAAFKISRAGSLASNVKMTWVPVEEVEHA